jgi:hypothetical protein
MEREMGDFQRNSLTAFCLLPLALVIAQAGTGTWHSRPGTGLMNHVHICAAKPVGTGNTNTCRGHHVSRCCCHCPDPPLHCECGFNKQQVLALPPQLVRGTRYCNWPSPVTGYPIQDSTSHPSKALLVLRFVVLLKPSGGYASRTPKRTALQVARVPGPQPLMRRGGAPCALLHPVAVWHARGAGGGRVVDSTTGACPSRRRDSPSGYTRTWEVQASSGAEEHGPACAHARGRAGGCALFSFPISNTHGSWNGRFPTQFIDCLLPSASGFGYCTGWHWHLALVTWHGGCCPEASSQDEAKRPRRRAGRRGGGRAKGGQRALSRKFPRSAGRRPWMQSACGCD